MLIRAQGASARDQQVGPQRSESETTSARAGCRAGGIVEPAGGVVVVGPVKNGIRQTPSMSLPPLHSVSWKPAKPTMW